MNWPTMFFMNMEYVDKPKQPTSRLRKTQLANQIFQFFYSQQR